MTYRTFSKYVLDVSTPISDLMAKLWSQEIELVLTSLLKPFFYHNGFTADAKLLDPIQNQFANKPK